MPICDARSVEVDPKIRRWKGGLLRLYALNPRVDESSDLVGTSDWRDAVYLERRYLGRRRMVPFGEGYALPPPPYEWTYEEPNVTLTFEVRDGRLVCVAISSLPGGPELTQTVLRKLSILEETRESAAAMAARLELDDEGEVIGVLAISPRERSEAFTSVNRLEAAADELGDRVRRPGRPPISDDELKQVARAVRDAEKARKPVIAHVAAQFHLSVDATKKRIRKARDRGLLSDRKENDDG